MRITTPPGMTAKSDACVLTIRLAFDAQRLHEGRKKATLLSVPMSEANDSMHLLGPIVRIIYVHIINAMNNRKMDIHLYAYKAILRI